MWGRRERCSDVGGFGRCLCERRCSIGLSLSLFARNLHGHRCACRPHPSVDLELIFRWLGEALQPPEEVVTFNHRGAHDDLLKASQDYRKHHCGRVFDHACRENSGVRYRVLGICSPFHSTNHMRHPRPLNRLTEHQPPVHDKDCLYESCTRKRLYIIAKAKRSCVSVKLIWRLAQSCNLPPSQNESSSDR